MRINELRKKNNNNKNKLDKRINWIKLINDKLRIALVFLYTQFKANPEAFQHAKKEERRKEKLLSSKKQKSLNELLFEFQPS